MAYKNTVAIIGATTTIGTLIAKSIVANYRILLMDTEKPQLALLQSEVLEMDKTAEVDILYCCKNASWESDIIVVANDGKGLNEIAAKMMDVSNCKTVLHFTTLQNNTDKLKQLLPHAKVASILWSQSSANASIESFILGRDKEAVDIAKEIVALITYQPQIP